MKIGSENDHMILFVTGSIHWMTPLDFGKTDGLYFLWKNIS